MAGIKCFVAVLGAAALLCTGCGKGDKASEDESGRDARMGADASGVPTEERFENQTDEARKAFKEMNGGKDIKTVDHKELKAVLPAEIAGAKRTNAQSQRVSQGGMNIASASADYEFESDGSEAAPKPGYDVEVMDLGNMSGALMGGYTMWATMEFENDTDTGYEKTTKFKGWPAMEKYDREDRRGELNVFVAKRFVLKVAGHDATIEQIHAAAAEVDPAKLESLAK